MEEKVSIIIPAYNREAIIKFTLNSVLKQSYTNWECIIIDDGSNDRTIEVINSFVKKDNRFISLNRPKSKLKGPSSCRNLGIEKASGVYVIFLDSDDLLASYCLKNRLEAFKKFHDNDFLVFRMHRFKNDPEFLLEQKLQKIYYVKPLHSFLALESIWQVTSPIYKLTYLKKIGGFNDALSHYEDLEFAIKCLYGTSKFECFDNADCFYRNDDSYGLKYKSFEVKKSSVDAFITFLKVINENIINKISDPVLRKSCKEALVKAYKTLFLVNIKDEFINFKFQNQTILKFLIKNNYLKFSDKIVFTLVQSIPNFILKVEGMGLYRLLKFTYR